MLAWLKHGPLELEEEHCVKEFISHLQVFLFPPFDQMRVSSCDRVIASPGRPAVCIS